MDSDDTLTLDAVETVLRYHRRYEDEKNICGYAFLRVHLDGNVNGKEFVPNERVASYTEARVNSDDTIRKITQFCRKHCLTPVAVGAPQFWIKNYIVCSPFQCLKMFARADFVFTDTFHGTIFASKYSKKFAVLVRESNRNKLGDLLKKIEMQEHMVMEISKLDEKYKMKKDMKNFQNIIEREKEKSLQYLRKNIGD